MKTLKEKIAVMQAYLDGKTIQYNVDGEWTDLDSVTEPVFQWGTYDYRIKPENKQVPFDENDGFDLLLKKFKHVDNTGGTIVCTACGKVDIILSNFPVSFENLARFWLKWNDLLNCWEPCTKTV